MRTHVFRLRPGEDLRKSIARFAKKNGVQAGIILTCVGSLRQATVRLAHELKVVTLREKFEIVSLVGTFEKDDMHLHISLSDKSGKTIGGHLKEGCLVHVTAEVAVAELPGLRFSREPDPETGFEELVVDKE